MANTKGTKKEINETKEVLKTTKPTDDVANLKKDLNNTKEELNKALSALSELKELFKEKMETSYTKINTSDKREYVTIVHLQEIDPELSTHIELSNLTIDLHSYGEERTLNWQQFEELVGKYKKWFDREIIALSMQDKDLSNRYNIKSVCDIVLDKGTISNIENLTPDELENTYNKISNYHKNLIISYWSYNYYEGKEGFDDRRKIELLNSLSDGALANVVKDINDKSNKN